MLFFFFFVGHDNIRLVESIRQQGGMQPQQNPHYIPGKSGPQYHKPAKQKIAGNQSQVTYVTQCYSL